jgi:putative salt-induced outer membrane protein
MNRLSSVAAAAILALGALPSHAQDSVTGVGDLDDRIDDITEAATDDLERADDAARFGPNGVVQGLRGSAAVTASGSSGNTDTADLDLAGRITYGVGSWSHLFGFAGEFGESDGVTDEETIFGVYEGSRAFTPQLYAFGTGRLEYDSFATNERDAFLGGGLGYRIVNTSDFAWRVQAGPGIRYIEDQEGESDTEWAGIASSRFFYGLTDVVSVTNDTDILTSDADTTVDNDFGINYRLSSTLSTRLSYRTEYNSDPLPDTDSTDNTIGLSLVVGF